MNSAVKLPDIQLSLKVATNVGARQLKQVWAQTPGVHNVVQTFPDETDDELARLYVVEVEPNAVADALAALRAQPEIEHVDAPVRRRIR